MTKTQIAETQAVKPLTWDSGPLEAASSYITAIDCQSNIVYFVEPFRSQYSGYRLWKAYSLSATSEISERTIQAARDSLARRFKTLTQAKEACSRHATRQEWPDAQVTIALTYRQYRLVDRAIERARETETRAASLSALDHALLAAIEKQLPPQYKLWKQQSSPREPHGAEEAVHILLTEPGFYALFRCLSLFKEDNTTPENKTDLEKLRKSVFRKIADHEQRIMDAKPPHLKK